MSYSEEPMSGKRTTGPPIQGKEQPPAYSYSPYLQSLPAMNGFVAPYHPTSSPRVAPAQYSTVNATPQSNIRAPSPLAPSWSPSYVTVHGDSRAPGFAYGHGLRQQKPTSPARLSNPTLIRTSTLQQSSSLGHHTQSFNPYAMYPSKAVLKLNGSLDSMTESWTKEEREAKRRLVQFTRMQSGSTIHADFNPVAPEDRAPNSICISCIYWDGKDECFITSVDTIYLLESLVGVRFTVEEKNRIRRNLEGFRPLTVSKAKADSEDFFKVIMGFPAPKPRNIEKDVKVFPWRILGHALKKIIGKYVSGGFFTLQIFDANADVHGSQSASYSSTAGALPTPISSTYTSNGAASDSGTEPPNAASPQSVSDTGPSTTYGAHVAAAAYSPPAHHHPAHSMTGTHELRAVLPAVSQPYHPMAAPYSYPAVCQQQGDLGLSAPVSRTWEINPLINAPGTNGGPTYNYLTPMSYSVQDPSH